MFGNDDAPAPTPPPLPPPAPSAPQFAQGLARPVAKGKPFGGTLLTSPLAAPAPGGPVAKRSLIGI